MAARSRAEERREDSSLAVDPRGPWLPHAEPSWAHGHAAAFGGSEWGAGSPDVSSLSSRRVVLALTSQKGTAPNGSSPSLDPPMPSSKLLR